MRLQSSEWFRNHYQARPGFRKARREYLQDVHCRLGGGPAVVFPDQRGEDARAYVPQGWTSLQQVVKHVGLLPLWLTGACAGTIRIVLRQPRTREERPALETPPTSEEYASAFGPLRAVRVPHAIHDTMVRLRLHHLGDYVDGMGTL